MSRDGVVAGLDAGHGPNLAASVTLKPPRGAAPLCE
jgi:hypothetical protein